jgi:hypothetical protein
VLILLMDLCNAAGVADVSALHTANIFSDEINRIHDTPSTADEAM